MPNKNSCNFNNGGFVKNTTLKGKYGFSAFSLIELSIVLIIIGLLVAGVTGGKSLIESARIRAVINEVYGWRQSLLSFYAAKGRLPGDLNGDGLTGSGIGDVYIAESYTTSSFPSPYNVSSAPTFYSAPFIDMYLEGTSDFKPKPGNNDVGEGYPYSKIFKKSHYLITYFSSPGASGSYSENVKLYSPYIFLFTYKDLGVVTPKIYKQIDEKIDDGLYNSGSMVSMCKAPITNPSVIIGRIDYDQAIDDKKGGECHQLYFHSGL